MEVLCGGAISTGVSGSQRARRRAPGFHFHDLGHTGKTFAASTGASTKELMSRMGHSSPRAALTYQHATRDRDRALADALSDLVDEATQSQPQLRLVEGLSIPMVDFWWICLQRDPSDVIAKDKAPDQTEWRRWDSNP